MLIECVFTRNGNFRFLLAFFAIADFFKFWEEVFDCWIALRGSQEGSIAKRLKEKARPEK